MIFGIGISDTGDYPKSEIVEGKKRNTLEYQRWYSMFNRCYSDKVHQQFPAYRGCSVSDNFKSFQYFAEWCQSQIGFGLEDYHLDKDILVKGNKVYSEDTCCFVPRRINFLILDNMAVQSEYGTGVCWDKSLNKFIAVKVGNTKQTKHSTLEEARAHYNQRKSEYVKQQAEEYKHLIDGRVYEALMKWGNN
jgi:hypothetical protein